MGLAGPCVHMQAYATAAASALLPQRSHICPAMRTYATACWTLKLHVGCCHFAVHRPAHCPEMPLSCFTPSATMLSGTQHCRVPLLVKHRQVHNQSDSRGSSRRLVSRISAILQQHGLAAFLQIYPYAHAAVEGLKFCYQLAYLLDVWDCHTPVLQLLGQRLVRLSGQEYVSVCASAVCCLCLYFDVCSWPSQPANAAQNPSASSYVGKRLMKNPRTDAHQKKLVGISSSLQELCSLRSCPAETAAVFDLHIEPLKSICRLMH